MTEIIEKDLSYVVNGCIFDVHNEVGPRLREECYQKAMKIRLAEERLLFEAKPRTRREVIFHGEIADVFEPDLVIENRLIVELKAGKDGFLPADFRQTINYLKLWEQSIGLLVIFGHAKADIKRLVFHEDYATAEEAYDYIRPLITAELKPILRNARDALLEVHQIHGLGFRDSTYRTLVAIGLKHRGLVCREEQPVTPLFHKQKLSSSTIFTPEHWRKPSDRNRGCPGRLDRVFHSDHANAFTPC